jgi:hypothetical protein
VILDEDLAQMDRPRRQYRRGSSPYRRSYSHDRYAESTDLRRRSYRASRKAVNLETDLRHDDEAIMIPLQQFEMRRGRDAARTVEAERIIEEEANALTSEVEWDSLNHHRREVAVKARRQDDIITVSPQMRRSRDYGGEHILQEPGLPKRRHRRSSRNMKTGLRSNHDSPDGTADDDIEGLVREWTTLYDPTTSRDMAAMQDSDIDGTITDEPVLYTYHSIQHPLTARTTLCGIPL